MSDTPQPYIIKSIPLSSGDGYEFELYAYVKSTAGAKKTEYVDLIYSENSKTEAQGFILATERESGEVIEFGTEKHPLPIELLDQMRKERGLSLFEIDENRKVNAFYLLRI